MKSIDATPSWYAAVGIQMAAIQNNPKNAEVWRVANETFKHMARICEAVSKAPTYVKVLVLESEGAVPVIALGKADSRYTGFEIHGLKNVSIAGESAADQVGDEQAEYFGLYVHILPGGICWIADCPTRKQCEELRDWVYELIRLHITPLSDILL